MKKILFLMFGIIIFVALNTNLNVVNAETNVDVAYENNYEEVKNDVFVNKKDLENMDDQELDTILNLSLNSNTEGNEVTPYALPEEERCYFWYGNNFSTAGYNAASSTFNGAAFSAISYRIHPALSIPLGSIAGYASAYYSPNTLYGTVEYYNCYYSNGNFKKVMKLTKYYYNSARTLQHSTYVG